MGDRRLGQTWSIGQRLRNDLIFAIAVGTIGITKLVPHGILLAAGRLVGRIGHLVLVKERTRARDRLLAAYPRGAKLGTREVFRGLGEELADAVSLLNEREETGRGLRLSAASKAALTNALAKGRGVIFVSAHLGRMERMASVVAAEMGKPVTTLARESYDPRFTALIEKMRAGRNISTIYRGHPKAGLSILRELRRNGIVGMPMDLAGRGVESILLEFLGEETRIPTGPARIGIATGASLVIGTPRRVGDGYEIEVEEVEFGGKDAEVSGLTRSLAKKLEARIRQLPDRWIWINRSA